MTIIELITIAAILLGPVLAIQTQKWLESRTEEKQRKIDIFKTLMATRGTVLSHHHVEALNRIDLEFAGKQKYRNVINAWKEYFDNLSQKVESLEQQLIWHDKNIELLANLLFEMGSALGYNFDRALIKRNGYSPIGHGTIENELNLIRKGILDILDGKSALPMDISYPVNEEELIEQKELRDLLIAYYQKKLIPKKSKKKNKR